MKNAFTMIELIITMVILSIVVSITSGIIAKTYKGYNQTNSIHKANLKLEIALSSIVNRLEYAIDGTIVKRGAFDDNSIARINEAPPTYNVLEWVGYDKDGFEANNRTNNVNPTPIDQPAWSGFCELRNSTTTSISTPGSDLNFADIIIDILSNHQVRLNNNQVAIFFPGNYDYTNIGYTNVPGGVNINGIKLITGYTNNTLTISDPPRIPRITEHYKLAWSAYAVVPIPNADGTFNLELRYNFRPWNGIDYYGANVPSKLLATNITVFKTYATENRIHIKICIKEKYGINKNASICKERVVYK